MGGGLIEMAEQRRNFYRSPPTGINFHSSLIPGQEKAWDEIKNTLDSIFEFLLEGWVYGWQWGPFDSIAISARCLWNGIWTHELKFHEDDMACGKRAEALHSHMASTIKREPYWQEGVLCDIIDYDITQMRIHGVVLVRYCYYRESDGGISSGVVVYDPWLMFSLTIPFSGISELYRGISWE